MGPHQPSPAAEVTLDLQPAAATFLDRAAPLLAADPVRGTVVATIAHRQLREIARGDLPDPRNWWLTITDDSGDVVGLGMCQPPSPDHRVAYVSALTEQAVGPLVAAILERGDRLDGMNGALPAVEQFGEAWHRATGDVVEVDMPTRLYELDRLVPAPTVPGALRAPRVEEYPLMAQWLAEFSGAAAEQGGRHRPAERHRLVDVDDVARRVSEERLWVWAVDDRPVHLTGHNLPSFGVARIGPVYTPVEHRGHGYAAAAVAEVSRRLQAADARVCLFTDRGNPVSNALYQRLGYRKVVDMMNLEFRREQ